MYHAGCKVEFQPFIRFYSADVFQLIIMVKNTTDVLNFTPSVNIKTILFSNIVLNIIPTLMRVI